MTNLIPLPVLILLGAGLIGLVYYVDSNYNLDVLDIKLPEINMTNDAITTIIDSPKSVTPKPNIIPFFKSFAEEINWYAQFESGSDFPELNEIPHICDPLIKEYKANANFEIKSHLAKDILDVCEL